MTNPIAVATGLSKALDWLEGDQHPVLDPACRGSSFAKGIIMDECLVYCRGDREAAKILYDQRLTHWAGVRRLLDREKKQAPQADADAAPGGG